MTKRKKITVFSGCILIVAAVFAVSAFVKSKSVSQPYECTGYAMGTYITQTVYGKNGKDAAAKASESIHKLENLISWRIKSSEISKLNNAAGSGSVVVSPATLSILKTSLDVAQKSGGAFDPTVLPDSSMWGFGGGTPHLPADSQIKNSIKLINYNKLKVSAATNTAQLESSGMGIDLGGIGKGAACDEAVAIYKSAGAACGIVAAGGSIGTYGKKEDGSLWQIAVRDPASPDNKSEVMGKIGLSSGFVSTSGPYEQFFTKNGKTYHHLLNPKTGYPENNDLVSVTVSAGSGTLSDALSTACFILGREKGCALLQKYSAGGIFIDKQNKVFVTDNLKNKFKILKSNYTLSDFT